MPAVTVPPRLNGLPIAITHSPSRSLSESPNLTAFSGLVGLTLSSARSVLVSRPMTSAFRMVPSLRMTLTSSAPLMTWLLVTTSPDASMMKPEPSELMRRGVGTPFLPCRFLKNSSKNSSNGEPGGSCGTALRLMSTVCLVEMLTTASITCSATSAIASGPRAAAGTVSAGQAIAAASKIAATGRWTGVVSEAKSAPMGVSSPGKRVAMKVALSSRQFKGSSRQPHGRPIRRQKRPFWRRAVWRASCAPARPARAR